MTIVQEEEIFKRAHTDDMLTDDTNFNRTRDYTFIIDLLRDLHKSIVRTIESWERFADSELQYFEATQESLRKIWDTYLASIEKDMTELRFCRQILWQSIETLSNKMSGVCLTNDSRNPPLTV